MYFFVGDGQMGRDARKEKSTSFHRLLFFILSTSFNTGHSRTSKADIALCTAFMRLGSCT